jgi:cytochrome P450
MQKPESDLTQDFDYTDPETVARLHEVFAQLRAQSAATHTPKFGGHWAVTRFDEVISIAKDTKGFTSTEGVTVPVARGPLPVFPIEVDPPEHSKYRQFLAPRFRKGQVALLEDSIRQITRGCLDAVREAGVCDLVPALTEQVPAVVIAVLLGLPEQDWDTYRELTTAMQSSAYSEDATAGAAAYEKFGAYLATALERRRHGEDDSGLLFQLANGLVDGEVLSSEVAIGMAQLVLSAGHETTASAAATQLHYLAKNPELRQCLIDDPKLIPSFVAEALRYEAPVTGMSRTATCPHNIDGNNIEPGDKVVMMFSAANHDERIYTDPDSFDIERNERSHLAFGFGVHRCLGEPLAILELEIIIAEVLRVIPDYQLEPGFDVTFTPGITRGPKSLPVTFTASSAADDSPIRPAPSL